MEHQIPEHSNNSDPDRKTPSHPQGESHSKTHLQTAHHTSHKTHSNSSQILTALSLLLIVIASLLVVVNQVQINQLGSNIGAPTVFNRGSSSSTSFSQNDLKDVDINTLKSTAHTVLAVFPVDKITTQEDAIGIMFPQGTPEYGEALGVSYDDPVKSLATLANMYPGLKAEVQKNNPGAFARFINLGTKPVGISCEYCCGIGPVGVDKNGNSLCGCQHNPALLSVALYLTAYTDYNDAEILREVLRWKTLFFPKNMIELGLSVAGKDASALADLPGMVGGC